MDRDRDRRYEDRGRPPGGESYRPGHQDDSFQRARSPPRRARTPPLVADTWAPSNNRASGRPRSRSPGLFRRRSRSPGYRGRDTGASYNPRPRSPRRDENERPRSPPRGGRRSRSPPGSYAARPPRPRSPPPGLKRSRDPSPANARRFASPPPAKRERLSTPPRTRYERPPSPNRREQQRDPAPRSNFRPRSRTPPRREPRRDPYAEPTWRRHSPSPARPTRSEHNSGPGSGNTSRRSSPPVHPDRLAMGHLSSASRSPAIVPLRQQYESRSTPRSPPYRARSPPRARERSPDLQDPSEPVSPQSRPDYDPTYRGRQASPPRSYDREEPRSGSNWSGSNRPIPSGPSQRNGTYHSRPPTGPARGYSESPAMSPPAGPSPVAPPPMSAHNRPNPNLALLSAPTRPRGGGGYGRGGPRESYNGPPQGPYNGPPQARRFQSTTYAETGQDYPPHRTDSGPPTGPRGGYPSQREPYNSGPPPQQRPYHNNDYAPPHGPPFRTNNSTSTTYPRTQRFNNPPQQSQSQSHLSSLPPIIPGGKTLPSGLDPAQEKRLANLELEKEKLLQIIEDKQREKRKGLREWDSLDREASRDSLRSELDESRAEKLSGEGGLGGSAF